MQKTASGIKHTLSLLTTSETLKPKKTQTMLTLTYSSRERIKETEKTVSAAFIFKAASLLL